MISQHQPMSSHELNALLIDLSYFLELNGLFSVIKTKKTGEAANLLEVSCKVQSETMTAREIASNLQHIWSDKLAFTDLNAFTVLVEQKEVALNFVTGIWHDESYAFATGTIHVEI